MTIRISALAASILSSLVFGISSAGAAAHPQHHKPVHHKHPLRMPWDYSEWTVAVQCESGGWQVLGSAYPDPFGINATNWADAGGTPMPVGPVPLSARPAAIRIADRFRAIYHVGVPHQDGTCTAW